MAGIVIGAIVGSVVSEAVGAVVADAVLGMVIESGITAAAADVLGALASQCPSIANAVRAARLAVNGEFAQRDRRVLENDECALIGLVSGG